MCLMLSTFSSVSFFIVASFASFTISFCVKALRKLSFVCQCSVCDACVGERKRAVIRCIYGLLCGTYKKPNLIKLIAFFSYTSQHVAEGQLNNFVCVCGLSIEWKLSKFFPFLEGSNWCLSCSGREKLLWFAFESEKGSENFISSDFEVDWN